MSGTSTNVNIKTEEGSSLKIRHLEGNSNWRIWKVLVEDWIAEREYVDVLTTTLPIISTSSPLVTQEDVDKWIKQNKKVLAAICHNC
ncbi:hypothetical protein FRC11_010670, partial [Ceratobasidium sp. 423]